MKKHTEQAPEKDRSARLGPRLQARRRQDRAVRSKAPSFRQIQGRFHTLFEESPVALWEEDYSEVKAALERLQQAGITDIRAYFEERPEEAQRVIGLSKVINVNRAALKLRGFTNKEELIEFKKTVVRFEPSRILMRLEAVAEGRTDFEIEGKSPTKNDGLRHTVWHYSVIPGYEKTFGRMIVSIQDVTASRTIENTLRQESRRLELLNSITSISHAVGDFDTSLNTLAERMQAYTGADACFISGWDEELQNPVFLGGTGRTRAIMDDPMIPPGEPSITRTVIDANHVVIASAEDLKTLNPRVETILGRKSALGLPLRIGEQKVGAVVLLFDMLPRLNPQDLELWNRVVDQVSLAVSSLVLYNRSQMRTSELEKLVEVSADLRQARDFAEIMPLLLHHIINTLGADVCALLIKHGNKWMITSEPAGQAGMISGEYDLSDQSVELMIERARNQAGGYVPNEYHGHSPWFMKVGSIIPVQLHTSEGRIGMIAAGWNEPHAASPENRRLLTTIADIAGNAFQRANLVETLEQRVRDRTRDLQILYDLSALANRPTGLKGVMQCAVQELVEVVNGRCGAVYQVKHEQGVIEMLVSQGLGADILKQIERMPLDAGRWSRISHATEPVYIPELSATPGVLPEIVELGMNALIWMPLRASGAPWGMIVVVGEVSALGFNQKGLMTAVSDLLGTVVENDMLQKRAKQAAVMEERQRLARDLHDSVTQSIYGMTLLAEAGREYAVEGKREPALHYLDRTSETAHQALREMRMLLYELRPPELEKLGLAGALSYRLEAVERRVGLEASIHTSQKAPISIENQEALFWIALEALNNTLKHAGASRVNLDLRVGARRLRLEIADNGLGFEPGSAGCGGMGLIGMRERAEKIGAQLWIESGPGKGTRVVVELKPGRYQEKKSTYE